jgi:hypothetical protein
MLSCCRIFIAFVSDRDGGALIPFRTVTVMPRFFYHMTDGKRTYSDDIGVELEGLAAARKHLVSHIRQLRGTLSDKGIRNWSKWAVIVSDDKNKTLQVTGFDLIPRI